MDHVLRREKLSETRRGRDLATEFAAKIEFIGLIRGLLDDGHKISMAEVQKGYERIRQENNVPEPTRKVKKNLLVDTSNDIEFHQPKRVNEPALISSKKLRDISIDSYEDGLFSEQNVECIFKAANILRSAILGSSKWEFKGSFTDINDTQVSYILQNFFRWLLIGPKETLGSDQRYGLAQQRVMRLAQSTISQCISER